jgi:1,5-anhydro-D-fructose reductase (1,5-anhydro-D-mannitol-forming)
VTIRWGIIGCGDVCEVKSGPGFQKALGSTLVAVMRRDKVRAADYARRHQVPVYYDDADALVNDPKVDAVYVATPPGSHMEHALRALRARKPAYVEKPMARTYGECARMVEAFSKARVPLFVAYYRRALDRFRRAKEIIASGRVGVITGVNYRYAAPNHRGLDPKNLPWRLRAEHAGGGLFLDLGCHTLDMLDFLFGPLVQVQGIAANRASPHDVEDVIAMAFVTEEGVPGTAHWDFASEVKMDRIDVLGTNGRLALSTFGDEPIELVTSGQAERIEVKNPPHIQQPLIQTIVDAIHGLGPCPSTGETAARTSAVMDRVLYHYYGSRDDGFWSKPATWPGRRV